MLIKNVKLLFRMTIFEARRFTMFPTEIIGTLLARVVQLIFLATFWLMVAKYSCDSNISPTQIISYYLIISGITSFFYTQMGIAYQIIKMIRSGELNQALIRPISPILMPWSQRAGRNFINLIVGGSEVIVGIILAGSLQWHSSYMLPIVLFNTFVINICLNLIIGSVGFYLIEAAGVRNAFLHICNLFGGVLIPLFLMPVAVSNAFQFTPFPAAQYHLTILLQGIVEPSPFFVAIGFVWAVVLIFVAKWFWRTSLGKYEGVGI